MIMSTAGWQESQEALQDVLRSKTSSMGGVMKTQEVRVVSERSSSEENSIELKALASVHTKDHGKSAGKDDSQ
jgi:diphthamide biosynthesis methyltransferase